VKRVTFAIPGDLATLSGGYGYDRRIVAELRRLDWHADVVELGDGFPRPDAARKAAALDRLAAVPGTQPLVIDGLAYGALPEAAAALRSRPVVALVHHPLALETGLAKAEADRLAASERAALSFARSIVATSETTARLLVADFHVPAELVDVVPPGTDRAPFAVGSDGMGVQLLAVGAVLVRKGFDLLVEALAPLASRQWRLTIVGDRGRDADAVARLDAAIARHRLQDRVESIGAVSAERLAGLYRGADLFVLASLYEGYGMAYAEAIAHGLPVVGTTGGAIPEVVPPTAGRLVPPGDVAALSSALHDMIADRDLRLGMTAGSRAAAALLPTWEDSGSRFAAILGRVT
jgi:glycosyltransferase involved in cell wall biosynthesis